MKPSASHWGAFFADEDNLIASQLDRRPSELLNAVKSRNKLAKDLAPMVRESVLRLGFERAPKHLRGKEPMVKISYEQAINLLANELKRIYDTYGPRAMYGGSYGWSCVGALNNPPVLLARLLNCLGGFIGRKQTYSSCALSVMSPYVSGLNEASARPTSWQNILNHSTLIIMWSANLLTTNEIAWFVPTHESHYYLRLLKESQIKVINIDPRRSETAKYLEAKQMFIKPGTDTALALALCYALIELGLADEEFCAKYTSDYEVFKNYLLSKDKSPKWASKICDISEEEIYELAKTMAANRTMIMAGWGMQRAYRGEEPHRAIIYLACLLGQIGLDGAGYGFNYQYSQSGAATAACTLEQISAAVNPAAISEQIYVSRLVDALNNAGGEYFDQGVRKKYPHIRSIYWAGGNFLHHHPGRFEQISALQNVDSFIVQDCFLTASARYADLFLPVCTEQERVDIARSQCGRYIFAMDEIFNSNKPSDYELFCQIANKLGVLEQFSEGKNTLDWLRQFYERACLHLASAPSMEEFFSLGHLQIAEDANDDYVKFQDFRTDPQAFALNTPSGKFEFYPPALKEFDLPSCKALSDQHERYLIQPDELILISPHAPNRLHSQLDNHPLARRKIKDKEPAFLHPQSAAKFHIEDEKLIKIYNKQGAIICCAKLSEDIKPGCISVMQGSWFCPDDEGCCQGSDVNVLISNEASSELANGNQATAVVKICAID